ncbi:hypothetical protein ACN469_18685 [Corallococcus terminator]
MATDFAGVVFEATDFAGAGFARADFPAAGNFVAGDFFLADGVFLAGLIGAGLYHGAEEAEDSRGAQLSSRGGYAWSPWWR